MFKATDWFKETLLSGVIEGESDWKEGEIREGIRRGHTPGSIFVLSYIAIEINTVEIDGMLSALEVDVQVVHKHYDHKIIAVLDPSINFGIHGGRIVVYADFDLEVTIT